MVKFITRTLILLLLFTFSGVSSAGDADKKLHTDCLYPAVYVGRADGSGYGSGVIVRSDKVNDDLYKNVFIT